jgi:hypothetical protein
MKKRKRDKARDIADKIAEDIALEKLVFLIGIVGLCLYVYFSGNRGILQ